VQLAEVLEENLGEPVARSEPASRCYAWRAPKVRNCNIPEILEENPKRLTQDGGEFNLLVRDLRGAFPLHLFAETHIQCMNIYPLASTALHAYSPDMYSIKPIAFFSFSKKSSLIFKPSEKRCLDHASFL